ncbi:centromere protein H [Morphnus guianensis]
MFEEEAMEPMQWEPGAADVDTEAEADTEVDVDADAAAAAAAEPERKADVLMLLRLRDQIKQQLAEYSTAVRARQVICCDYVKNQNKIKKDIEDWERRLEEVTISLQNKTLALQRIQLTFALRNKMKQNDDDSRLIMETVKRIVTLSQRIIKCQQQAREKEQKLIDIRRKRLTLKTAGREKLLQVHTVMKKQKEEQARVNMIKTLEVIRNKLEKEIQMTTVIKNVFQSIIIASRVNWAEDPSLKAIVLQLEDDVYLL